MTNPKSKIASGIRDENPCGGCERPWKKAGCHDTCPDRRVWVNELERVKANRIAYEKRMGYR
jgi:hypothetical protein